eukprot:CAMPEP_0176194440 /NCGR_PEP_ID=MMETSP0121_2-20121125/6002_1 /TAXON_ID=160619 /ORGANISM="Kryptoperidinium foliaceum, Strain CCMP 1326" /LENGTH=718 /DNA_ID=CAMNT_0017533187 /DNA_START=18 /DNA_END=2174 /DNA_ORIENTATION=-
MIDQVETSAADIKREVAMLRLLEHPCVIKLYDVYHEKVFVCMVMELYRGGDMIQGMMHYWKTKGMIPIAAMRYLTKQMWEAVGFVHAKNCIHRDVKGDNFMMDFKDVSDMSNRLYLSDFGTVCELAQGQRLNQKCGTRNYWSPELFKLNYGHKVDNWAIGVVMYGLITGKFPFKGEEDVKHKVLNLPKRCPPEGVDLINKTLERNEAKRLEATQALAHTFLASVETAQSKMQQQEPGEGPENIQPEVMEFGANAGVRQRREELVQRLQQAAAGGGGRNSFMDVGGTLKLKSRSDKGFVVLDPAASRSTTYEWWSPSKAEELCAAWAKAPKSQSSDLNSDELSADIVRKMLTDHNIPLDKFGKGQAKTFEEFVAEIQRGESRLQLDASKHKHIVRVVDVIALRLEHGSGSSLKYLIEVSVKYPDGRIRQDTNQMPGDKKGPHENAIRTATRLVERLGLTDVDVAFDPANTEMFEQIEDSPSYPGVQSIYRKEVLTGTIKSTDAKVLERLGVSGGKFVSSDGKGYETTYAWLTQAECTARGVKTSFPHDGEFSTLVYPPIGLGVDELEEFMQANKVDTSRLSIGTARSLQDFSEELVKGEATLQKLPNGQIKRIVDVVIVKIARKNGDVIVEAEEAVKDSKQVLKRLPAAKRRHDEHQFLAARRLVMRYLRINENSVQINEKDVRVVEEETESKSYPGLSTIYRKRFLTAEMTEEAFITF